MIATLVAKKAASFFFGCNSNTKKASFAVTAVGRYAAGSFKLWCDDTLCELKRQLEDSYESSQGMITFLIACFYA